MILDFWYVNGFCAEKVDNGGVMHDTIEGSINEACHRESGRTVGNIERIQKGY